MGNRNSGRKRNTHADFIRRLYINTETKCWEWIGPLKWGYGQFWINGEWWLTHRYAYQHYKGEIGDKYVCHSCDNPKCCNPEHLFLGSQHDNIMDSSRKGRWRNPSPKRKLTLQQAEEIRTRRKAGESQRTLAKLFNISDTTIAAIMDGKIWKTG